MKKSILKQFNNSITETPEASTPAVEEMFSKFVKALQLDEAVY